MFVRLLCALLLTTSAGAAEMRRVDRWELHSSFWMNLHQTLMHDASTRTPRDISALSPEERIAWESAVAAYRQSAGPASITFTQPMMVLQNELAQVADDAKRPGIDGPLADAIRKAAPVYRSHWWPDDDRINGFLLAYTAAMLRDAGEELIRAHEDVYRERFPKSIRVDFAAYAGTFGAYSHPLADGFVVTISSREPGNHGLAALELVLHESSHSIVSPWQGSVSKALTASSRKAGIDPPRDLWHAILFATTSELTRRALARRGATGYIGFDRDLLTRAWPQYRAPIERHWLPYLSGQGTLEEAIEKIVLPHPAVTPAPARP
jgi:hypothetical protein